MTIFITPQNIWFPRNWTWDPISNTLIVTGNKNYSSYHFIINKPVDIPDDKINIIKVLYKKIHMEIYL